MAFSLPFLCNTELLQSYTWEWLNYLYWYIIPVILGITFLGFILSLQLRSSSHPIDVWQKLNFLPRFLQKYLFTRILWLKNPFAKQGRIYVDSLKIGKCICKVKETRSLRNPFQSLHAAELILLGETSAGLALFSVLKSTQRAIVTEIQSNYLKKARGVIVSVSKCHSVYEGKMHVISELREESEQGTLVASVAVIFLVASKETKKIN